MSRELYRPKALGEAALAKDAKSAYLAGGTEVLRRGSSVREEKLIMLKDIPQLRGIEKAGPGLVRIGGMTTFEEGVESQRIPDYFRTALRYMASRTKRNMATVGGNVSLMRDDSYLAAVLIAAHAGLEVVRKDEAAEAAERAERAREAETAGGNAPSGKIREEEICIGRFLSRREEYRDALIKSVLLPDGACVLSKRYANTAESHSYLTVALGRMDGHYRLGVSVKNSGVFFPKDFSEKLGKGTLPDSGITEWAEKWEGLDIPDDIYGSQNYKRYLLGVTVCRLRQDLALEGGRRDSEL